NLDDAGHTVPAVYGDPVSIPELCLIDTATGQSKPLTSFNAAWQSEVAIATSEAFYLDSPDGAKVHCWTMKPVGFDSSKKYPAILEVHGGPHTQYGWVFFHEFQVLAAQGYVVVFTNPRGSKGYGEAFCNAIKGDWGNKDWIDVQTATAWMKSQPFVDQSKLGIMGGSYGGYMTNWAIGHTHDFKAAITDRCVSNMVSMAGNSDFPVNKDGYFHGTAWGNLEDIKGLWAQSPISFFTNVKTPTLIIHSEGDLRCNIEQSEQVFIALKMQKIETRFVRYPKNTSHGMSRNGPADLRMHRLQEIVNWWKRQLI
ncbi:MAG: S9 family peptidase, partial [Armatimonadota bacterium]